MRIIGIYKITSPTGKIYVGQSCDINKRKNAYETGNCKRQLRVFKSIVTYGWMNHKFEIIETCSKNLLDSKEKYWQEFYNVTNNGNLNCIIIGKHTEETRLKISKTLSEKLSTNKSAVKVVCTITNKKWNSIKQCALELNMCYKTLQRKLLGISVNNTTIKYYTE